MKLRLFREQFYGLAGASRGKSAGSIVIIIKIIIVIIKIIKIIIKIMENNIRNGAVRWQISKSIKVIPHPCAYFHNFRGFCILNLSTPEYLGQGHNSRSVAIRWRASSTKVVARISTLALIVSEIITFKMLTSKIQVKVTEYKYAQ